MRSGLKTVSLWYWVLFFENYDPLFTHFGLNHLWKLFRNTSEKLFWEKKARSVKDKGGGGEPKNCTSRYCRSLSSQSYWSILMFYQIPKGIYLSMSKPQVMIYLCTKHLKSKVSKKNRPVYSRLLAGIMSVRYCFSHFSMQ